MTSIGHPLLGGAPALGEQEVSQDDPALQEPLAMDVQTWSE